jgi:hypothetical protein
MYGLPPVVPDAFASVIPAGRFVNTNSSGPAIDCCVVFCTVTVLLYVLLDLLYVKLVDVILTKLVTFVATATGFADASFDIALVPLEFTAVAL